LPDDWVVHEHGGYAWAFDNHPWVGPSTVVNVDELDWQGERFAARVDLIDIATSLIRLHLLRHCARRGLVVFDRNMAFFPDGLLPNNRLTFESYSGRRTWIQVVGERNFRRGENHEPTRYHIATVLRPSLRKYGLPVIQVDVRLHLTDQKGVPTPSKKAFRRSRQIRRNWWNLEWLSRLLAIIGWLADGRDEIVFDFGFGNQLVIAARPARLKSPIGYDDSILDRASEEEDETIEVEDEDVADEEEDDEGL
jgi:hypothetical protein